MNNGIKPLVMISLFVLCICKNAHALSDDKFQDPAVEVLYDKLNEAYEQRKTELLSMYMDATPEERGSLPDLNIEPYRDFVSRYADAAHQYTGKQDAFPFLLWLVRAGQRLEQGKPIQQDDPLLQHQRAALSELLEHHTGDERILNVVVAMTRSYHISREFYIDTIQAIKRDTQSPKIQAECAYALALREPDQNAREQLFESALAIDPDSAAAEKAKSALFELRHLSVGSTPPDFVGESPDDTEIRLSDYRGKIVVIYFTSINCGPCLAELPATKARVEKYRDQPFVQLDIHTGPEPRDAVKQYAEKHEISWPIIHDQQDTKRPEQEWYGPIGTQWNIYGTPTVFVLDSKGVIRNKNVRGDDLELAVQSLIESRE